jgi:NADH:ubiquinone oxidoreductase subunit 2 (subunit N)
VRELADLDRREFAMLAALAIAVLAMGLYPKPFTDVMHTSVVELLRHVSLPKLAPDGAPTMNWQAVYPVLPEIALLVMACVVALTDLWVPGKDRIVTYCIAQTSLGVIAIGQLWFFYEGATYYAMQRMVVADPMGHLLGLFATLAMMTTLVYTRPYAVSRDLLKGELFTLSMFSLLGILVMLAANNFLVVYLGLELMSLSLYALVAMRRDDTGATEAAMKYFVLGALASGFLLYGLSMMYGATGSLEISEVFRAIGTGRINRAVLVLGTVFVVAGLAFKLGAVPFHMWVPDVYQGAPTSMTLLVGGAPKLAAFAISIRLLVEGHDRRRPRLAADAGAALARVDATRQPGGDRPEQPEADARVFDDRPDRLHAARPVPRASSAATPSRPETPTARRCST